MRTNIYVDGFNLYYGALKNTPWKWLDLSALFRLVLKPHHRVATIKYFTARVRPTLNDPSKADRQDHYLETLSRQCPEVEIHFGHFLSHVVSMPRAPEGTGTVNVIKTEEKGSDVMLAVQLVNDAWTDAYECAVVVSNDSDLAEAMRLARVRGKLIGLVTPSISRKRRPSRELRRHADFHRGLQRQWLERSQMPARIPGTSLRKPDSW